MRKIWAIYLFVSYVAGPIVLKKAHISDRTVIIKTYFQGKKRVRLVLRNIFCWRAIV